MLRFVIEACWDIGGKAGSGDRGLWVGQTGKHWNCCLSSHFADHRLHLRSRHRASYQPTKPPPAPRHSNLATVGSRPRPSAPSCSAVPRLQALVDSGHRHQTGNERSFRFSSTYALQRRPPSLPPIMPAHLRHNFGLRAHCSSNQDHANETRRATLVIEAYWDIEGKAESGHQRPQVSVPPTVQCKANLIVFTLS